MEMYEELYTYENLERAFYKARKHKTLKPYVISFEKKLKENLLQLQKELKEKTYLPKPLETFIISDPKTRKISKSDFRDRVVHHALCNIIEPLFDKSFIYDSYANRLGKGTLNAIKRFDVFKKKVSKNNHKDCYILKADIKHYFENVDHNILIGIIQRKIPDDDIILLIKKILKNHRSKQEGKGMPLGNLTSQFFANVYLNEIDQYVKHQLNAKYYIRYVDDFIILDNSIETLQQYKLAIDSFIKKRLFLSLHPDKSKIFKLEKGANFLGFRIFYNHILIRKKNIKKFERAFNQLKQDYKKDSIEREMVIEKFEGWIAYIKNADTYKYRRHITKELNKHFPIEKPIQIIDIKRHENHLKRTTLSEFEYSPQKTLQLYKQKLSIKQIAEKRGIKESTVWEHLARLIEHNQCTVWEILSKEKILKILKNINNELDLLKDIKKRIKDDHINYDEIACVLASVKAKNKKKNIIYHFKWYKKNHCHRKCYNNLQQQRLCENKFKVYIAQNPTRVITKREFLIIFNNQMKICILPEKEKRIYISYKQFKEKRARALKN